MSGKNNNSIDTSTKENKVTKNTLIDLIYDDLDSNVEKEKINNVIDSFITEIRNSLENGATIELRGFGTFEPKYRRGKKARNPKTGENVSVPPHYVAVFRPGKDLKANMEKIEVSNKK